MDNLGLSLKILLITNVLLLLAILYNRLSTKLFRPTYFPIFLCQECANKYELNSQLFKQFQHFSNCISNSKCWQQKLQLFNKF